MWKKINIQKHVLIAWATIKSIHSVREDAGSQLVRLITFTLKQKLPLSNILI